jgi:glycosyltransferase A (GT-A) superfamily protein (DUF2064 family)
MLQAFEHLERVPAVLGPSLDGGYYLVGAKDKTPPLFDRIAWSTWAVWDQTMSALADAGLCQGSGYEITTPFGDVDTLDDLRGLRRQLSRSDPNDDSLLQLVRAIDVVLGSGN